MNTAEIWRCPSCDTLCGIEDHTCPVCGTVRELAPNAQTEPASGADNSTSNKKSSRGIALIVILCLSLLGNALLAALLTGSQRTSDIKIKSVESELVSAYSELYDKKAKLTAEEANKTRLLKYFKYGKDGIGSNNFKVNQSIILLKPNQTARITFTTSYPNGCTVSCVNDGDSASLVFTEESWDKKTELEICGISSGLTVFTMTNDYNKDTFSILAVVE